MPARRGSWDSLAPGTRRRWIGRFGGRGAPEVRARRAKAAYELGGIIRRAEAGHEPAAARAAVTMSAMFVGLGWSSIEAPNRAERSRIARWNSLVAQLVAGRITPKSFERRVKVWRPFRGESFEWDPAVITATMDARREAGLPTFEYTGRRS